MKPSEELEVALALISQPGVHIRSSYAMTEQGNHVYGFDAGACRFCSIGALQKVQGGCEKGPALDYLRAASRDLYDQGVVQVNDHLPWAAVQAMWTKAIELAEESGR
jgi:hypothetical protein